MPASLLRKSSRRRRNRSWGSEQGSCRLRVAQRSYLLVLGALKASIASLIFI